ncbi:hypothetical protein [Hymenobacter tenuis]
MTFLLVIMRVFSLFLILGLLSSACTLTPRRSTKGGGLNPDRELAEPAVLPSDTLPPEQASPTDSIPAKRP